MRFLIDVCLPVTFRGIKQFHTASRGPAKICIPKETAGAAAAAAAAAAFPAAVHRPGEQPCPVSKVLKGVTQLLWFPALQQECSV